jgi:hypothetical protein
MGQSPETKKNTHETVPPSRFTVQKSLYRVLFFIKKTLMGQCPSTFTVQKSL